MREIAILILVMFCFFEIRSQFVAQVGLELSTLLPQPLKSWDYRHMPHTWLESLILTMTL